MTRMTEVNWAHVDRIFADALNRAPAERSVYLDTACACDDALRAKVDALLASAELAERELGESVTDYASPLFSDSPLEVDPNDTFGAGARVGPYRVIREHGRGGMGVVYEAERADEQYEQRVALKVVKRGMDTDEVLRRFRAERQILASLEHPNIARLYDGGATQDGRPYLVLEYVDGLQLDTYCEQRDLDLDQRLVMFTTVCAAVQHAHRNLIVHRDLKPSNVLVSDEGVVKLLDFGIAKLLAAEGGSLTPDTRTGLRLLTPDYAAPEQLAGAPPTIATDVWALGVMLYALLTGGRPTNDRGAHSPLASTVARMSWRRRIRGDLDLIIRKALDQDPRRRYASAQHLLDDIERHRAGLPITARAPNWRYRTRKYVRRHRVAVTTGIAALATLVGSSAIWAIRVTQERDTAQTERASALAVAGLLEDLFSASDPFEAGPERRDTLRAQDLVRLGAERVRADESTDPAIRARMLTVLGRVHGRLGLTDDSELLLREAVDTHRAIHQEPHPDFAETLRALSYVLSQIGRYDEAERLAREALAMLQAIHGNEHPAVADAMHAIAIVKMESNDGLNEAEAMQREAVAMQRRLLDPSDPDLAAGISVLASLLLLQGEYPEAESLLRESLELRRRVHGDDHPSIAVGLNNLGTVFRDLGRWDEAAEALGEALAINRAALGPEHPNLISNLNTLASVRRNLGDLDGAVALLDESITLQRRLYGDTQQSLSIAWDSYARVLQSAGHLDSALTAQREAEAVARRANGEDHWTVGLMAVRIGSILRARDGAAAALPHLRSGIALMEGQRPPGDVNLELSRLTLGETLRDLTRLSEAESEMLRSHAGLLESQGPDSPFTRRTKEALAALYEAWERPEDAERYR